LIELVPIGLNSEKKGYFHTTLDKKIFIIDIKSPSKIHFFNKLPKGFSGKIQRLKIKDLLRK